ncbi:MAG: hypothetical protein A2V66_11980 [Ignavibacteria bacterium RBG_13_36_8]|nr:MAG: hypothetical protein A2V66_11980 [Ignavibacteria bacterium RBG_13_36_8]
MKFEGSKLKADFRKRLYFLTLKIIEFIDQLPHDNVSQKMADELFSSGTSVIGSYIEAQAADNREDFTYYINFSIKSVNETKLWLGLLRDSNRAKAEKVKWFLEELDDIHEVLESIVPAAKE